MGRLTRRSSWSRCGKPPQYRCRLGCILVIWVAFSSRCQRYCCRQEGQARAAQPDSAGRGPGSFHCRLATLGQPEGCVRSERPQPSGLARPGAGYDGGGVGTRAPCAGCCARRTAERVSGREGAATSAVLRVGSRLPTHGERKPEAERLVAKSSLNPVPACGQQGQPSPLLSDWSRELASRLPISPAAKFTPQIPALSPAESRARDVAAAIETLDRLADPTVPMDEVSPDKLPATRGKRHNTGPRRLGCILPIPPYHGQRVSGVVSLRQVGARSGGC